MPVRSNHLKESNEFWKNVLATFIGLGYCMSSYNNDLLL